MQRSDCRLGRERNGTKPPIGSDGRLAPVEENLEAINGLVRVVRRLETVAGEG